MLTHDDGNRSPDLLKSMFNAPLQLNVAVFHIHDDKTIALKDSKIKDLTVFGNVENLIVQHQYCDSEVRLLAVALSNNEDQYRKGL